MKKKRFVILFFILIIVLVLAILCLYPVRTLLLDYGTPTKGTLICSTKTGTLSAEITDSSQLQLLIDGIHTVVPIPCGISTGIDLDHSTSYDLAISGNVSGAYSEICSLSLDENGFLYTKYLKYHLINRDSLFRTIEQLLVNCPEYGLGASPS